MNHGCKCPYQDALGYPEDFRVHCHSCAPEEGCRRMAACEAVEVIGMMSNPSTEEYFTVNGKAMQL